MTEGERREDGPRVDDDSFRALTTELLSYLPDWPGHAEWERRLAALSAAAAPREDGWEELRRLAAAVGDYKWLLNGRDKAGRCTLGCEATEGQYHADDCPAGILSAAYLAAVDRLVASPAPDPGADQ